MKKPVYILSVSFSYLLSIIAIIISVISIKTQPSANSIYNNSLKNVVEVKAESEKVGESFGTGEIVSTDGRIITNAHVITYSHLGTINKFDKYYVRFAYEDDYHPVELVKYNIETDIAILKFIDIGCVSTTPIILGNSDKVKSGDKVYAVGNASNYGIGIFSGIVSVPLVNIELENSIREVIQCDLTIAAGNSGGALLNKRGELIGLTTFRTKDSSGNVVYGIVYCIPINAVINYMNEV